MEIDPLSLPSLSLHFPLSLFLIFPWSLSLTAFPSPKKIIYKIYKNILPSVACWILVLEEEVEEQTPEVAHAPRATFMYARLVHACGKHPSDSHLDIININ